MWRLIKVLAVLLLLAWLDFTGTQMEKMHRRIMCLEHLAVCPPHMPVTSLRDLRQ